jgi:hypothetical protein
LTAIAAPSRGDFQVRHGKKKYSLLDRSDSNEANIIHERRNSKGFNFYFCFMCNFGDENVKPEIMWNKEYSVL